LNETDGLEIFQPFFLLLYLQNNQIMRQQEYDQIGYIKKPFGYKGEMIFLFDIKDIDELEEFDFLFFNIDGELVPFLIENFSIRDEKSAVFKIEDIDNSEDAKKYIGCGIYLTAEKIQETDTKKSNLRNLSGFAVVDTIAGQIGNIEEILSLPEQDILKVKSGEKEILIPDVEEIVINVDLKNKIVIVTTPEGLLDL